MRSRLVMLLAIALAVAAVALAITRLASSAPAQPPAARATLSPEPAAYLGRLRTRGAAWLRPDRDLRAGGRQAAEPGRVLQRMGGAVRHVVRGHDPHSMAPSRSCRSIRPMRRCRRSPPAPTTTICARMPTASATYGHAVVIGFGHEMNAPWYTWGYRHIPASTFVAAWRHIVTLFRDEGAENVTWLWTLQADRGGHRPGRVLVARRPVRHLGRHRRLLLPPLRYLRQRLRHDH